MRIPKFLFICFILLFTDIYSQNTITIAPSANLTSTSFDVEVRLNNSDLFKGLQFDISFSPDAFQLGTGHYLTNRATGFNLGVSSPAPGTGRVIIYSSNNAQIAGGDGLLLTLKFRTKTLPGTFPVTVKNIVASDSLGASLIVQGSTQDMVVNGPVMNILTPSVSFGEVPLLSTTTQNLRIQNSGNMPLTISGLAAVAAPFGIQNNFPVIIQPNGIEDLTVTLNTSDKVETSVPIQFVNNDPDPLRNLQQSNASVRVFAVNEIYVGSGSGVISSEIQIPVAISNMEPFSGFQFDVILPAGFKFAPNSIVKSERFTGHMISSSVINSTTLRFIAYASDNSFFTGNSGEVFRFSITPNVSSGYYTLPVNSAIISNPQMGNIISQAYNGSVQINSPDLMISPNALNYGDVPITENRASSIMLTNNGSSELIINEISYDAPEITFDAALPISILPGDNKTVQMTLSPKQSGLLSKKHFF